MTVEQFAQMQTGETEDYELVEGELLPLSSGTYGHAKILCYILTELVLFLRRYPIAEALAEMDCRLSGHTVRRPDVDQAIPLMSDRKTSRVFLITV